MHFWSACVRNTLQKAGTSAWEHLRGTKHRKNLSSNRHFYRTYDRMEIGGTFQPILQPETSREMRVLRNSFDLPGSVTGKYKNPHPAQKPRRGCCRGRTSIVVDGPGKPSVCRTQRHIQFNLVAQRDSVEFQPNDRAKSA